MGPQGGTLTGLSVQLSLALGWGDVLSWTLISW